MRRPLESGEPSQEPSPRPARPSKRGNPHSRRFERSRKSQVPVPQSLTPTRPLAGAFPGVPQRSLAFPSVPWRSPAFPGVPWRSLAFRCGGRRFLTVLDAAKMCKSSKGKTLSEFDPVPSRSWPFPNVPEGLRIVPKRSQTFPIVPNRSVSFRRSGSGKGRRSPVGEAAEARRMFSVFPARRNSLHNV